MSVFNTLKFAFTFDHAFGDGGANSKNLLNKTDFIFKLIHVHLLFSIKEYLKVMRNIVLEAEYPQRSSPTPHGLSVKPSRVCSWWVPELSQMVC